MSEPVSTEAYGTTPGDIQGLSENAAWLSTTIQSIGEALIATDTSGVIAFMNSAAERLTGWSIAVGSRKKIEDVFRIVNAETGRELPPPIYRAIRERIVVNLEQRTHLVRKDGIQIPVGCCASPTQDQNGRLLGAVLIFRDNSVGEELIIIQKQLEEQVKACTIELAKANADLQQRSLELRHAEEEIRHRAYHDTLTGLPNSLLFKDRLKMAIAVARRNHEQIAVMLLELDRFALINETVGHETGDQLIQEASRRLRGLVREVDTLARHSDGQFALLLQRIQDRSSIALVADRIIRSLREMFTVFGSQYFLTVSIGTAIFPDEGTSPEQLLEGAGRDLWNNKKAD